jgi:hypothetical protein
MVQTKRDNNGYPTAIATSNADGSTPVLIQVNVSNQSLVVEDGTAGSDLSGDIASRDQNNYPVLMGVSSVDGVTPTAIYANPATGALLIKTT